MKRGIYLLAFGVTSICFAGCKFSKQESLISPSDTTKKYALIWSEEFNYTGLPDSTKWSYETGYQRNHEKQYYTYKRSENARVEDGMLGNRIRKGKLEGFCLYLGQHQYLGEGFISCEFTD